MGSSLTLQKKDVLFGRGSVINSHPGNRQFRSIIDEHKPHYNDTFTRKQKREFVGGILDHINRLLSGPRFLEEVNAGADGNDSNIGINDENCVHPRILAKSWAVTDREKVVLKILHRLREKIAMFDNPKLSEQEGGKFRIIVESNPGIAPPLNASDDEEICAWIWKSSCMTRRSGMFGMEFNDSLTQSNTTLNESDDEKICAWIWKSSHMAQHRRN